MRVAGYSTWLSNRASDPCEHATPHTQHGERTSGIEIVHFVMQP
jgi:hypothetical protein